MSRSAYLDTSALAKWYLHEARSEDVEAFLRQHDQASISRLAVVELRCLLARRRRHREIDTRTEQRILATFRRDVGAGFLEVHPLEDRHALTASDLISKLVKHPLRTLDALHLAVALGVGATRLATADRIMAAAATSLGIHVERFD